MPVDKFGRMSDTKTRDTGVSLTYINNNYIRRDGDTPVSGSINMNGNTLYNVTEPIKSQDVATKDYADYIKSSTKDYVDYIVKEIREKLEKKPHIIAVTGSYTGNLRKYEYQFSFGGNKTGENRAFLIPHSGRIKKIVMRLSLTPTLLKTLLELKKVTLEEMDKPIVLGSRKFMSFFVITKKTYKI